MFNKKKKDGRSFLEKLTGVASDETPEFSPSRFNPQTATQSRFAPPPEPFIEEDLEGELAVDVYETNSDIIIHTMTAGVRPDELTINITPEMVTISGRRESAKDISHENYVHKELYWGSFSRTIQLPKEIDPDLAEAVEKHGLLIIKLPKLDKDKLHRLKVKSA